MKYDYIEHIVNDIALWVDENDYDFSDSYDENFDDLEQIFWIDDDITGNGSGAYFSKSVDAENALCHNWDLVAEMCEDWGTDALEMMEDPIKADVSVRCYLLRDAICNYLDRAEVLKIDD